jgi:L-alanine-DL-glutamate epimerase-like enolase superfamily enzyme
MPVLADESVRTSADLPALRGRVDGINIKLMKCGGLQEAVRMIAFARDAGWRIMVGCRIETSLAITAAAHLSGAVDDLDLDGHLFLAADPFRGVTLENGRLMVPAGPGLGVVEAAG